MKKTYDFNISITCRHDGFNELFKENAIKQVKKLSRYHAHIMDGNITVDKQSSTFKVEISLRIPGFTILAAHEDYSHGKALDNAIDKAKTQLKKIKSKIVEHRVRSQQEIVDNQEIEKLSNS